MTLRTRITLLTAGLLLVAFLVLGFALEGLLRNFLYGSLRTDLKEAAIQVVRLLNLGGQALLEAGLGERDRKGKADVTEADDRDAPILCHGSSRSGGARTWGGLRGSNP